MLGRHTGNEPWQWPPRRVAEVIAWDEASLSRARVVLELLETSEAWAAYIEAFGAGSAGTAWIEIADLAALIRFRSLRAD